MTRFSQWNVSGCSTGRGLGVLAQRGFVSGVPATATCPREPVILRPGPSEPTLGVNPQHRIKGRAGRAAASGWDWGWETALHSYDPPRVWGSVAIVWQSYRINTQIKTRQEKRGRKEAESAGLVRKYNKMVEINPNWSPITKIYMERLSS